MNGLGSMARLGVSPVGRTGEAIGYRASLNVSLLAESFAKRRLQPATAKWGFAQFFCPHRAAGLATLRGKAAPRLHQAGCC